MPRTTAGEWEHPVDCRHYGALMSQDPDILPDDKDWTWVLQRPCDECGFDPRAVDVTRTGELTRDLGRRFADRLAGTDAAARPAIGVWSPVEYACHVRDVAVLFDDRLALMLTQDDPVFANWDQDETAVRDRYREQDPAVVAEQVTAACDAIAQHFDTVSDTVWERTGRRSDGAAFTVDSFARYLLHDVVHHAWDVTGDRWA